MDEADPLDLAELDRTREALSGSLRMVSALAANYYEALIDQKIPHDLASNLVRDWLIDFWSRSNSQSQEEN